MSRSSIFDTNVLIDQIRNNSYSKFISLVSGPVRLSSVVLAELARAAVTEVDAAIIHALTRNHPIVSPTEKNWIESGHILAKMRKDKGFDAQKLRDLHFDVLIALTARSCGACLVTSNRKDFELIRSYRDFELEVW